MSYNMKAVIGSTTVEFTPVLFISEAVWTMGSKEGESMVFNPVSDMNLQLILPCVSQASFREVEESAIE